MTEFFPLLSHSSHSCGRGSRSVQLKYLLSTLRPTWPSAGVRTNIPCRYLTQEYFSLNRNIYFASRIFQLYHSPLTFVCYDSRLTYFESGLSYQKWGTIISKWRLSADFSEVPLGTRLECMTHLDGTQPNCQGYRHKEKVECIFQLLVCQWNKG